LFISIDFINKFKENENLALKLVQTKKRALNELKVIQFKERQKISTILHNRYQSQLTGFRLYFGNKISSDEPILKEMKRFEEEIRDFSHQILPKELENGLLHDAIYRQIKFLSQVFTDWKISYQAFDFKDEIKEDWIYDIYLILSELIQNSIKHSNGNKIDIEFFNHESEYLLTYSENGNSLDKRAFEQGFGISLIKDQIENIGSEIRFELNPNLFIIVRIPK
jgi:signal transduction histidine kinase